MTWQDEARLAAGKDWWTWIDGMLPRHVDGYGYMPDGGAQQRDNRWQLGDGRLAVPWWYADVPDAATVGCLRGEVERIANERGGWVTWFACGEDRAYGGAVEMGLHCDSPDARTKKIEVDETECGQAALQGLVALRALTWLHEEADR